MSKWRCLGCLRLPRYKRLWNNQGLRRVWGVPSVIAGQFSTVGIGTVSRETRIQIMLDDAELAAIDDWRFKQRMPSRAAAIRQLLQVGLGEATGSPVTAGRPSRDFGVFQRRDFDGEASE